MGVNYGTLELAISRMHPGDYLFVIDLQGAFFNWRVHPSDTMELGFYSPKRRQFGKYDFFPFGLSIAPGVNDESVKELLRLLVALESVTLTDFVDDLLGSGASLHSAWDALERSVRFFISAGVPVSSKPTGIRAPAQRQVWIGWVFDTLQGVVSVTEAKCCKCRSQCIEALELDSRRELSSRFLASAAGLASHIAEIYPQARRRLHPVWADLNAAGVYAMWKQSPSANPPVRLSESSRHSLHWLADSLEVPP